MAVRGQRDAGAVVRSGWVNDRHKKARALAGMLSGQAMMFSYRLRVCVACAAVWLNAAAVVGPPVPGCKWLAHWLASCARRSMVMLLRSVRQEPQ